MSKFKEVFRGLVAYVLLGVYVYAVVYAGQAVSCLSHPNCQLYKPDLTSGFVFILTTIGALIAALVVAELAVTPSLRQPAGRTVTDNQSRWASAGAIVYMVVWLICGLYSVIVGFLLHPDVVPPLTAEAKSWMGLAVAAIYSYFAIKPT